MIIHNSYHLELYAQDTIRERLLEAENYRMLTQLRKQPHHGIHRTLRLLRGGIGRALISLGEWVEDQQLPSATQVGGKFF